MNKFIVTTVSALLLASGSIGAANDMKVHNTQNTQTVSTGLPFQLVLASEMIKQLPEYNKLTSIIDIEKYVANVTEDSKAKRVIVLVDEDGTERYKSVFIKFNKQLKIIDHRGNEVTSSFKTAKLSDQTQQNNKREHAARPVNIDLKSLAEYPTLNRIIDVAHYKNQIVVDNVHQRILVLKDESGKEKFKSIFNKSTNQLKVIDANGGVLFNGSIR